MDRDAIRHAYLRKVIAPVMRAIGPRAACGLTTRLARGIAGLESPTKRRIESRIADALRSNGMSSHDAQGQVVRVVVENYQHVARFWTEALFIRQRLRDATWRTHVCVDDESALAGLADGCRAGRGCVLATVYLGNPAVAAVALGHLFRRVHVVMDWLSQPGLARWQSAMYSIDHVRLIDRRDAARRVPDVLASGGAVLIIAERERARGVAVETPFLGRALRLYPTLGRLARWCDVPVAAVTCTRGNDAFGFRLAAPAVVDLRREAINDAGVVRATMSALEAAALKNPEQYYWAMPTLADLTRGAMTDACSVDVESRTYSYGRDGRTPPSLSLPHV